MKKLFTVFGLLFSFILNSSGQGTFSQAIGPFYWVSSTTPFTFTATPPTTGSGKLVFSWGACWQTGFGPNELHIYLNTSSGSQQVVYATSVQACLSETDSITIPPSILSDAIAFGGGNITGSLYIYYGCAAGWGCSNYNQPAVFGMSLEYTSHSANFTSSINAVCPGGSVSFTDQSILSPNSWQWTFAGGTPSSSGLQNPTVTYNTPGTYDVTLIASNGSTSDTITYTNFITVYSPPVVNAGLDTTICFGNSVTLNAAGGLSYTWYPPIYLSDDSIANPVATPVNTTAYTVTATDQHGCTGIDEVVIIVHPLPFVIASTGTNPICLGDSAFIVAAGAQTYVWSPSSSLSAATGQSVFAHPFNTTTYTITGTDFTGCVNTDTITIVVNPLPPSPSITQLGGSIISSPAAGYQWYLNGVPINGATSQSYIFSQNGSYTVMITDGNGCEAMSLPYSVTNTGLAEHTTNGIMALPNPTNGIVYIYSEGSYSSIKVYDIRGRQVLLQKISGKDTLIPVNISSLEDGSYFVKAEGKNGVATIPVVKISE